MQAKASKKNKPKGTWFDVFKTIFWALLLALLFRSFLYEPFHIPSKSMQPTLEVGDFLVVSKYSYGYSRYSFPFGIKVFDGRKWYDEPERGDIVVFKVPDQVMGKEIWIKRLVGLPGDKLQVRGGKLYINGQQQKIEDAGIFKDVLAKNAAGEEITDDFKMYVEKFDNGTSHYILDETPNNSGDNTEVYEVPEGHFFMMGDNRDNSNDSRFPALSFVPAEHLIGRAEIILFSSGGNFFNPLGWKYNRFFTDL